MSYENPQLPEGINYSQDNPLKELLILLGAATAIVAGAVFALALAAGWLATKIPFATEREVAAAFVARLPAESRDPAMLAAQQRLQAMADRIARLQGMPPDMVLEVHIVDDDAVNAFATLGGHLLVTRGILAELPHENALVTLLAHEAAHVRHRDPVVALGRGVAVLTALGVIVGVSDSGALANHLQGAGLLTSLTFNRDQERAADAEALRTLEAWYGHTAGAADLFDVLARQHAGAEPPAFLSTHPATDERIATMRAATTPGTTSPLPAEITEFVKFSAAGPSAGRE